MRWRDTLRADVRQCRESPEAREQPTPPFTTDTGARSAWWSAMTLQKMDNLELFCARHAPAKLKPETLDGLPEASGSESAGSDRGSNDHSDDKTSDGGNDLQLRDDLLSDAEEPRVPVTYPPVGARRCGRVPHGQLPLVFLGTPAAAVGNGAEAKYARGYASLNSLMQRTAQGTAGSRRALPVEAPMCTISGGDAQHRQEKQAKLFCRLDAFTMDDSILHRG